MLTEAGKTITISVLPGRSVARAAVMTGFSNRS